MRSIAQGCHGDGVAAVSWPGSRAAAPELIARAEGCGFESRSASD